MLKVIHYDGWLCGNDAYPSKIESKYKDKVGVEVYGFNSLATEIAKVESNWAYIGHEYKIAEKIRDINLSRKSWDHFIKLDNRNIFVEFDGAQHYTNMKNFINDDKFQTIAVELEYEVVRIHYFIQLNNELINYYFNTKLLNKVTSSFPHGFRTNGKIKITEFKDTENDGFVNTLKYKAVLPTEFHQFGLERFEKEMQDLSRNGLDNVVDEIKESLKCRANDYDWDEKYTIPRITWR